MRLLTCIVIALIIFGCIACKLQSADMGFAAVAFYLFFRIIEMAIETFLMPEKSGLPDFKNPPSPPLDRPTRQPEKPRTNH